jgi:hypothetical protein
MARGCPTIVEATLSSAVVSKVNFAGSQVARSASGASSVGMRFSLGATDVCADEVRRSAQPGA